MEESLVSRLYDNNLKKKDLNHSPDVLSCLANLSNDEVFTPPEVVNQMLDMLPQELFCDPNTKFLDPACKTGVFLREIAKRLLTGLEPVIPDLQQRIDHIFKNQLYGIAITELTSLISRRSLYCSKYPNGEYSVCKFDNPEGNIRFKKIDHSWNKGKCIYCKAQEKEWGKKSRIDKGLESHAYEFIHILNIKEAYNMAFFDVIISNPPYQLDDGGASASATPIYNYFVENAKKLNPRYMTMIIPSRWFAGGKGLDDFRDQMLNDNRIREIHDYVKAADCFPGIKLEGGACYFLWDRDHPGDCLVKTTMDNKTSEAVRPLLEKGRKSFIRFNEAIPILNKVVKQNEDSFDIYVSARKPFGISTNTEGAKRKSHNDVKVYGKNKSVTYFAQSEIPSNLESVNKWKVFISYAYGYGNSGFPHQIINKPFLGEKGSACTETYLLIGPFINKEEAENVISYMETKFFRFLVLLMKYTQHATKNVYSLVPIQDFQQKWTDEKLYKKYGITEKEIEFIESLVKPMEDVEDGK